MYNVYKSRKDIGMNNKDICYSNNRFTDSIFWPSELSSIYYML